VGVGDEDRERTTELPESAAISSSWTNVEQLVAGARARFVRLRRAENRIFSRHRFAALHHFLCAALASRTLPSSGMSEDKCRFFSGSSLGGRRRRQKMQANVMAIMTARATDNVRTRAVPWRDEDGLEGVFHPVGKDE
jgi:hypothetical protein